MKSASERSICLGAVFRSRSGGREELDVVILAVAELQLPTTRGGGKPELRYQIETWLIGMCAVCVTYWVNVLCMLLLLEPARFNCRRRLGPKGQRARGLLLLGYLRLWYVQNGWLW